MKPRPPKKPLHTIPVWSIVLAFLVFFPVGFALLALRRSPKPHAARTGGRVLLGFGGFWAFGFWLSLTGQISPQADAGQLAFSAFVCLVLAAAYLYTGWQLADLRRKTAPPPKADDPSSPQAPPRLVKCPVCGTVNNTAGQQAPVCSRCGMRLP